MLNSENALPSLNEFYAGLPAPLSEIDARRWIQEIDETYRSHPIFSHPHLQHLGSGMYPDHTFAIKDHAHQVFAFGQDFRAYLGLTLSKLKGCEPVRDNLLQHLREENGIYTEDELRVVEEQGIPRGYFDGRPHMVLYADLLRQLGVTQPEYIAEADHLNRWMIDTLRKHSATVGTVMIFGVEIWAMSDGEYLLPALRKAGITTEDSIFFDLHDIVDSQLHVDEIGHDIFQILSLQPPENSLQELKRIAREFYDERMKLWDALYQRSLGRSATSVPSSASA
jgi:hypothetical protein